MCGGYGETDMDAVGIVDNTGNCVTEDRTNDNGTASDNSSVKKWNIEELFDRMEGEERAKR